MKLIPQRRVSTRRRILVTLLAAACIAAPPAAAAQTTVSTIGSRGVDLGFDRGGGGGSGTFTIGQTFRVPNSRDLTLVSFELVARTLYPTGYTARLFALDPTSPTSGPIHPDAVLFEQRGAYAGPPGIPDDPAFTLFWFSVNRTLAVGTNYAFVVSFDWAAGVATRAGTIPYDEGNLVFSLFTPNDVPRFQQPGSLYGEAGWDTSFTAHFAPVTTSVVPEPATTALLGTGLLVLGGVAVRRRKRTE